MNEPSEAQLNCIHEQVGIYNFDCHDCFQRLHVGLADAQKIIEELEEILKMVGVFCSCARTGLTECFYHRRHKALSPKGSEEK